MTHAYVGLGANIGEPRRQIETAIEEIRKLPDTRLNLASSFYRSAPLGYANQPDFLNAAVQLETTLPPEALLGHLQAIEKRHGRQRPFPGAPRTLDLDLLLYGEQVIAAPGLILPHPRMHERAFVLLPLAELAPDVCVPGFATVAQLAEHVDRGGVEKL